MINPWAILGVVVIASGMSWVSYYKGNESGKAEIQQLWDNEKAEMLAKYVEEVDRAREKERNWQQTADTLRQEKEREVKNLTARATALSNSLRQRQDRATATTGNTSQDTQVGQTAAGCTGAELYREDGNVLVGEAARADKIRLALKQCYAQYDALEQQQ